MEIRFGLPDEKKRIFSYQFQPNYYNLCRRLLRPKGLIAIDNTIYTDINTITIRELNEEIKLDQTVDVCQLRLGDERIVIRKK